MAKTEQLIELYTAAPLTFADVVTQKISSKAPIKEYTTTNKASGLIFPLSGSADFIIEGTAYELEKGYLLHVGPNLQIQSMVAKESTFEYAVIHFTMPIDVELKFPLFYDHFLLQVGDNMKLGSMLQQLIQNYLIPGGVAFLRSKAMFLNILEEIILSYRKNDFETKLENMDMIIDFIQQHYQREITVNDIANHFDIERRKFTYLFEKKIGVSPTIYLTELRIGQSKFLLRTSDLSISEIAESVGYNDYFYFSRVFKKVTGLSPTDFRKFMK